MANRLEKALFITGVASVAGLAFSRREGFVSAGGALEKKLDEYKGLSMAVLVGAGIGLVKGIITQVDAHLARPNETTLSLIKVWRSALNGASRGLLRYQNNLQASSSPAVS